MSKYKNRKKKTVIIVVLVICLAISTFLGSLYYITTTVNNYSYNQKNWINQNITNTFDIYIPSSLPIFSNNGSGVYYDYLTALKNDTGLNFNITTTDNVSIKMTNKSDLKSNDIVFYRDHYIVVSTGEVLNKLDDLTNKSIGIISEDESSVSYYLTDYDEIDIKTFDTFVNNHIYTKVAENLSGHIVRYIVKIGIYKRNC